MSLRGKVIGNGFTIKERYEDINFATDEKNKTKTGI
jgi:hypothetical protein